MTTPSRLVLVLALLLASCGDVLTLEQEVAVPTPTPSATLAPPAPEPQESAIGNVIAYGSESDQILELSVPDGEGPFPVVVLIHGGFWREQYKRDLMEPLAADLVERGVAAVNLEYGRVGGTGGWPDTFEDVAAGLDHVATLDDERLDLDRVAVVGHSAGGHLASWSAARLALDADQVGGDAKLRPCAIVSQAGVNDLTVAATTPGEERTGLGNGATQDLLGGGPDEVPERYDVADPARRLPLAGVPWLAIHGAGDDTVPLSQSEDFATALNDAGGDAEVRVYDGDHFIVIDPTSEAWVSAVAWMAERCRW